MPARAQAHRRPDVRGRHLADALLDLRHRRVRRCHPRATGHHPGRQGGDAQDPGGDPGRHVRPRVGRGGRQRPRDVQQARRGGQAAPDRAGRCPPAAADVLDCPLERTMCPAGRARSAGHIAVTMTCRPARRPPVIVMKPGGNRRWAPRASVGWARHSQYAPSPPGRDGRGTDPIRAARGLPVAAIGVVQCPSYS
ncbi:hypothetical protein FAGKG844_120113 [Frankia sp. AgKG'84/4]